MSCLGIIYEFVSGSCNPIRMDIFQRVTRDTRDVFAGVEKMIQETFLPRLLFGNTENHITHCRSSKYDVGQESRTWTPEYSDTRTGEVLKIP